jgi:ABC-type amino acid transport substrate-binding protein
MMKAKKRLAVLRKRGRRLTLLGAFFVCLMLILNGAIAVAQTPDAGGEAPANPAPVNQELTVGLSPAPPFVIQSNNDQGGSDWDGIGVQLWREVAYELDLDYQWQEALPDQAINDLESGTLDVALITATAPREQQVDFTQSYFATTLGISTARKQRFWDVVKAVVSPQFLQICLWLSLILLVVGIVGWFLERQSNEDMFNKSPAKGIWDGFWWAGVTMSTIGYGDKAPVTVGGRILALLWMLIAMGITASLTASITSVLVLDQGVQGLQVQQLKTMQVGTVANTSAASYLRQQEIQFQEFDTPAAGLKAVDEGSIDAFVEDTTALRTLNQNEFQKRLRVKDTGIQMSQYTFALPQDSPLRETLNQQILQELSEPDWSSTLQRYLPSSG